MMKYSVWTIYDKRTKIYQEPSFYRTDDVALATFSRSYRAELAQNPHIKDIYKDFVFIKLADFNDSSGKFWTLKDEDRASISMELFENDEISMEDAEYITLENDPDNGSIFIDEVNND